MYWNLDNHTYRHGERDEHNGEEREKKLCVAPDIFEIQINSLNLR